MDERTPSAGADREHAMSWGDAEEVGRPVPAPRSAKLRYTLSGLIIGALALLFAVLAQVGSASLGTDPIPDVSEVSSFELRYLGRVVIGGEAAGIPLTNPTSRQSRAIGDIGQQARQLMDDPLSRVRGAVVLFDIEGASAALGALTEAEGQLAGYRFAADRASGGELVSDQPMSEDLLPIAAEPDKLRMWADELGEDAETFRALAEWGRASEAGNGATTPRPIDDATVERLLERHGWFAERALTWGLDPSSDERRAVEGAALRTFVMVIVMVGVAVVAILLGFVLAIVGAVMLARRSLRPRFNWQPDLAPASRGALLEAVAVFLVGFGLLSFVMAWAGFTHPAANLVMWLLLLSAAWPLVRGVSRKELMLALGWHANGRGCVGALKEAGLGFVGYLAGLPIVLAALAVSLVLVGLTQASPSHPVVNDAADTSLVGILLLYSLAAVWAPVVEETVFRGAFYASIRPALIPILAGAVNAFVFAIIHPQGWALTPALASLGFVFSMIREWRGSLIGPIVAHALHNGFIVTLLIVILS